MLKFLLFADLSTAEEGAKLTKYCPKILKKMSRDTLVNPLPPLCVIWWQCLEPPPPKVSRII